MIKFITKLLKGVMYILYIMSAQFNQYYLDLIKLIKSGAKSRRTRGGAARTLLAIKTHYVSFDKLSVDYLNRFKESTKEFYDAYSLDVSSINNTEFDDTEIYINIPLKYVKKFVKAPALLNYLCSFGLFVNGVDIDESLEAIKSKDVSKINDTIARTYVNRILESAVGEPTVGEPTVGEPTVGEPTVGGESKESIMPDMGEIENTTLGKLAREIVGEIDISGLQQNMPENGNLFEAFSKNAGLGNLVASVGNKIQNKLSSGELNQEALLQDAISLATKLPGMMGGGGGTGGLDIGAMMKQFQGMGLGDMFNKQKKGHRKSRK